MAGGPATAVTLKLALRPPTLAESEAAPAVLGSVHLAFATPDALVEAEAGETRPFPEAAKLTDAPLIRLP